MIPLTDTGWQSQPWQTLLSNAVTDINEIVRLLGIDVPALEIDFPLLVPMPYLARIERGNPDDPLLRQVLPIAAELETHTGFHADPLHELEQTPVPGMLHKYQGRVLIITTGACAVNCRYCFRRHFPYEAFQPDSASWDRICDYIESDPSIREVILSGGDPLVQPDRRLAQLSLRLAAIEHVETLRLHTRLPVVIPQRVDQHLTRWIEATRLNVVVVIHANHAREIDDSVAAAMARLRAAGATLLNQSVLLRGVNDDTSILCDLSESLFQAGILPYYLHLPDRVRGAAHFDVPDARAQQLHREMASRLPGYLLPRLVREVPGEAAKSVIA